MRKVVIVQLLIILSGYALLAQSYPAGDFHVALISDTHISNDEVKDARLMNFIDHINKGTFPGVEFLMHTGDVGSSVYKEFDPEHPEDGYNRLGKAVSMLDRLSVPYYLAMGNHDYKIDSDRDSDLPFPEDEIERMEILWTEITNFNPYYSFTHKGWKFIVLNSMHGRHQNRFFGDDQVKWLEKEIDQALPVVLYFHHPLVTDHHRIWGKYHHLVSVEEEPAFFDILSNHKEKVKGIFVGHGHRWVEDKLFNTIPVYETDSFGEEEQKMRYYIIGFDKDASTIAVSRMPLKIKYKNEFK